MYSELLEYEATQVGKFLTVDTGDARSNTNAHLQVADCIRRDTQK